MWFLSPSSSPALGKVVERRSSCGCKSRTSLHICLWRPQVCSHIIKNQYKFTIYAACKNDQVTDVGERNAFVAHPCPPQLPWDLTWLVPRSPGSGLVSLTVSEVSLEDAGHYLCRLTNRWDRGRGWKWKNGAHTGVLKAKADHIEGWKRTVKNCQPCFQSRSRGARGWWGG